MLLKSGIAAIYIMRRLQRLVERLFFFNCSSWLELCLCIQCIQYILNVFNVLIFTCPPSDLYGTIGLWICISLILIDSINIFLWHHYFSQSMLLANTPLNEWLVHLNNLQEHRDHEYCGHRHHSMSDVVLMVDSLHVLLLLLQRWSDA